MEVGITRTIYLFKIIFSTQQSFWVEMNVQPMSESVFSMEQIQKQAILLKSSEVYLSNGIEYAGVVTKRSTWKINWDMLHTTGM